ncbi:MAG: porin [Bacteroidaceae bacterium]|nr:porin [Bacteroidaceae bacterium]
MKRVLLLWLAVLFGLLLPAQEQQELLNLKIEARGDYQHSYIRGATDDEDSGFKGKFLNIRIDGNISEEFSYSYRQRLNKNDSDDSFFDATDWIYLTWKKRGFEISAGKLLVALGGYEYDVAPIDLYFCSEWWHNLPCYQLGVSVGYSFNGGKDKIIAQLCESPFRGKVEVTDFWGNVTLKKQEEMFACNFIWTGSHGWFNTAYSVNMIEYLPGKYINYISLGHKLDFGEFQVELDFMNRATSGHTFLFTDMSAVTKISWQPTRRLNIFAKGSYDVNNTDVDKDFLVAEGTEVARFGGGVEYFPLKDARNDVRIHAAGSFTFGDTPAGVLRDNNTFITVGVTWRMNLLSLKNKIL